MEIKKGKIKFVQPSIPPQYSNGTNTFNKYDVEFADGNKYQFLSKGNFKKEIGEEIEYTVKNEEQKTAKLNYVDNQTYNSQILQKQLQLNSGSEIDFQSKWILMQVVFKEVSNKYNVNTEAEQQNLIDVTLKLTDGLIKGFKERIK